ncbi:MAG: hypothetical protein LBC96_05730 [Lachnospiraceae bacterium]|jgi:tetratricopeptide (TPR) repeat protein|nr:hypothetical protein [Lachnospiraceae bacterium]
MTDFRNMTLNQLLNHQHNSDSWYWLGMAYMEIFDAGNAINWLEKAMNNEGHEWADKATQELAYAYIAEGHPYTNRDKALDVLKRVRQYLIPQLLAGLLLYHGTETRRDPQKGKQLVEKALQGLEEKDSLHVLSAYELNEIAAMYESEGEHRKAEEYTQKVNEYLANM